MFIYIQILSNYENKSMKKMLLYFILCPNTQVLVARDYHPLFLTFCLPIYFQ